MGNFEQIIAIFNSETCVCISTAFDMRLSKSQSEAGDNLNFQCIFDTFYSCTMEVLIENSKAETGKDAVREGFIYTPSSVSFLGDLIQTQPGWYC
jgi:hypothetical protein